jgi:hypothetical protein
MTRQQTRSSTLQEGTTFILETHDSHHHLHMIALKKHTKPTIEAALDASCCRDECPIVKHLQKKSKGFEWLFLCYLVPIVASRT